MSIVKTIIVGSVKIKVMADGENVDLSISNLADGGVTVFLQMSKPQTDSLGAALKALAK